MTNIRRIYLYAVAFVSLLMLASGLSGLGRALVEAAAGAAEATIRANVRGEVTQNGALILVGLPVWLLHWRLAERAAGRDPAERASTLRRLYVYAVLAAMALSFAAALYDALAASLRLVLPSEATLRTSRPIVPLPRLLVAALFWAYHREVAGADRALAGERGGSATLRRWYTYGVAFVGLIVLLVNTARVLRLTWEAIAGTFEGTLVGGAPAGLASAAAAAVVGLALWLVHWRGWAARGYGFRVAGFELPAADRHTRNSKLETRNLALEAQDARSVLRPVYLFLALAVAVATTLYAASQMLFYALGRLLGVARPGGVGGSLLLAMAGPASLLAVYGVGWLYHRRALAAQALAQPELPRQAGVRRLYVYLISLVALAVLATGAGGLLWTLADLITNAPHTVNPNTWWREQISLHVTLVAAGLPVWLLHWGPAAGRRAQPDEAASLARRLYVYLTLLAGVLALLGAGAVAAKQILDLALGEAATPSVVTNLARALAAATVAGVTVFYHQRVLRADVQAQASRVKEREEREDAAPVARGAPSLADRPFGVVYWQPDAGEQSSWFATADEARAAFQRLHDENGRPEWVALVRVEADSQPPSDSDLGPEREIRQPAE